MTHHEHGASETNNPNHTEARVGLTTPPVSRAGAASSWLVKVPIRLVSEANARSHWAAKARRTRAIHAAVLPWLRLGIGPEGCIIAAAVTLTRIAPKQLDTDNLARAHKAVQDCVARWLGVDDAPRGGVRWSYEQRRGEPREYSVEIKIDGWNA